MAILTPMQAGAADIQVLGRTAKFVDFGFLSPQAGRFKTRTNSNKLWIADRYWVNFAQANTREGLFTGHVYKRAGQTVARVTSGTPYLFGFIIPDTDEYEDQTDHLYRFHISGSISGQAFTNSSGGTTYSVDISPILLIGSQDISASSLSEMTNNPDEFRQLDNLQINGMSNKSNATFHGGVTTFDFRECFLDQADNSGAGTGGYKMIVIGFAERPTRLGSAGETELNYYGIHSAEIRFSMWKHNKSLPYFNPDL